MSSKFTDVIACVKISLLFKAEWYSIACRYHMLFIYSSTDGDLGCFHFWLLWIMLLWTWCTNILLRVCFKFLAHGISSFHCGHAGSSSLTSDWTQAPCIDWEYGVLATGPPRKSLIVVLICISLMLVTLSIFSLACESFPIFFGEIFIQVLCPLLNWVIF